LAKTIPSCIAIVAFTIGVWGTTASAATLITDDEAKRPIDPHAAAARGITRGPSIRFEDSKVAIVAHKPFEFRVKIEPHGGATIDPTKVHVTYLKMPNVDLTERLRPFIATGGINMPDAVAPAGDHPLLIDVEDSDGHTSHAVITLTVAKKRI